MLDRHFLPCTAYAVKEHCFLRLVRNLLQRPAGLTAPATVDLKNYKYFVKTARVTGVQLSRVIGEVVAEGGQLLNRLESLCRELEFHRQLASRKRKLGELEEPAAAYYSLATDFVIA